MFVYAQIIKEQNLEMSSEDIFFEQMSSILGIIEILYFNCIDHDFF